jgi:hypothetical protein
MSNASPLFYLRGGTMNREIRFGLLLHPTEKRALNQLAEVEGGLSRAATLRRLIRKAAHEKGLWPPTNQRSETQALPEMESRMEST